MVVILGTRILEHNMQQKAGISAGNLKMAKTKSIKSRQTIIQQNVKQIRKEIAEQPKSMKPHKEIT
jgi:hypothetical protein